MRCLGFLALGLALIACGGRKDARTSEARPEAAAPTAIDPRDQLKLIAEIYQARKADEDAIDERYSQVRNGWVNRRYQWEGIYSPALCRSATFCPVTVYNRLRTPNAVDQGWIPSLKFEEGEYEKMRAACENKSCGVVFEGTLAQFTLSSIDPTNLTFEHVKFVRKLDAFPTFGAAP